ncbi:hypothetical protein S83_034395 [Arachis hypogaea]
MSCCTDLWIYSAGYGLWDFVLFVLGLEDAGYAVGARVLELLCHRDKAIDNYLGSLMSWDIIRNRRETRLLGILSFVHSTVWKVLFGKDSSFINFFFYTQYLEQ